MHLQAFVFALLIADRMQVEIKKAQPKALHDSRYSGPPRGLCLARPVYPPSHLLGRYERLSCTVLFVPSPFTEPPPPRGGYGGYGGGNRYDGGYNGVYDGYGGGYPPPHAMPPRRHDPEQGMARATFGEDYARAQGYQPQYIPSYAMNAYMPPYAQGAPYPPQGAQYPPYALPEQRWSLGLL
jgi:hypothetical protein